MGTIPTHQRTRFTKMLRSYIRDGRAPIPKNERISRTMSAIRAKNTKPELLARKLLSLGGVKGYRMHPKNIPGRPDIAFSKKKIAVFVHGCYWHGCLTCELMPKTHRRFWKAKFERNRERDARKTRELRKSAWRVVTIWEHQLKRDEKKVARRLLKALG